MVNGYITEVSNTWDDNFEKYVILFVKGSYSRFKTTNKLITKTD